MCSSNRHREWNIRIIFGADVIGPTAWVSLLTWRLDFWRARSNMREFLPSTPEPLGVSGGAPIFRSVDLSLRREWSSAAKSSPSAGDTSSPRRQAVVTSSAHHQPAGAPPTSHPVQAFRSVMVLWTITLEFSRARRGNCKSILKHARRWAILSECWQTMLSIGVTGHLDGLWSRLATARSIPEWFLGIERSPVGRHGCRCRSLTRPAL